MANTLKVTLSESLTVDGTDYVQYLIKGLYGNS